MTSRTIQPSTLSAGEQPGSGSLLVKTIFLRASKRCTLSIYDTDKRGLAGAALLSIIGKISSLFLLGAIQTERNRSRHTGRISLPHAVYSTRSRASSAKLPLLRRHSCAEASFGSCHHQFERPESHDCQLTPYAAGAIVPTRVQLIAMRREPDSAAAPRSI